MDWRRSPSYSVPLEIRLAPCGTIRWWLVIVSWKVPSRPLSSVVNALKELVTVLWRRGTSPRILRRAEKREDHALRLQAQSRLNFVTDLTMYLTLWSIIRGGVWHVGWRTNYWHWEVCILPHSPWHAQRPFADSIRPCQTCTIIGYTVGLEFLNGENANINKGLWLHQYVV